MANRLTQEEIDRLSQVGAPQSTPENYDASLTQAAPLPEYLMQAPAAPVEQSAVTAPTGMQPEDVRPNEFYDDYVNRPEAQVPSLTELAKGGASTEQAGVRGPLTPAEQNYKLSRQLPDAMRLMTDLTKGTGLSYPVAGSNKVLGEDLNKFADALAQAKAEQTVKEEVAKEKVAAAEVRQSEAKAVSSQQKAAAKVQKADENVLQKVGTPEQPVEDSKGSDSSWSRIGNAIAMGLAVGVGEYGRVLTGGKENLALNVINKAIDTEISNKKLNQDEAQSLRAMALQQAAQKAREKQDATQNEMDKKRFNLEIQKFEAEQGKILADMQKRMGIARVGDLLDQDSLKAQPPEVVSKAVRIPGTKYYGIAIGTADEAAKARESVANSESAIAQLNELRNLAQKYSGKQGGLSNFLNPKQYLADKAAAEATQKSLIGLLRVDLFGPGALTEGELKIANDIIKDPTNVMGLNTSQLASYDALIKKTRLATENMLRNKGIEIPKNRNMILAEKMVQANPQRFPTTAEAMTEIIEQGDWQD